jgi:plastocyanin
MTGGELNSPLLNQGQSYSHTFTAAGTYKYTCNVHPNMVATVTVQ